MHTNNFQAKNMKKQIKKLVLNYLDKKGFERKNAARENKNAAFYNEIKSFLGPKNNEIISVIFSKDRAMQLDGFLVSYFANVENYSEMVVLYHTSNAEHEQSYTDLKKIYQDKPVRFVKENAFRKQLLEVLETASADRVFFYVDDMIFSQKVNYNWFSTIDPLEYIPSLTRGKDLTYSTVLGKELQVPQITPFNENLYQFDWNEIKEYSDWSYPLGVSGYMYSRPEIFSMLKVLDFKAPNSLESSMQHFFSYFINRKGICLENVATPCVHTNLTQTEGYNNVVGHFSLEELLVLWNENKRIDCKEFMGIPAYEAELKKYNFIVRNE